MSRPLLYLVLLLAFLTAGCGSESPASAGVAPQTHTLPPGAPTGFNPAACGTITGLVTWVGPVPEITPITHISPRPEAQGYTVLKVLPPNVPRIDQFTRGLAGAVVFLREVEPALAKPWDLPAATVEFRDSQIVVQQGTRTARTGFVRRGDSVTFLSAETQVNVLRVRGAAFFALPFPEANQPLKRTLDTCGQVELTSASGFYWQSAELFVCDHPYYAISDKDGRFEFMQVPAGEYELVAWHPNWFVAKTERNPESGQPNRLYYAPPLEISRSVEVVPGRLTLANLTFPK